MYRDSESSSWSLILTTHDVMVSGQPPGSVYYLATETARERRSKISSSATRPKVPEMMYTWVWRETLLPWKQERDIRAVISSNVSVECVAIMQIL